MGITKEHLERIEKQAKVMESFGDAAVDISSELDAIVQDNYQMEQLIERLLETNDRLRKQLDSDAYMKLPLDADGIAISPGDKIYFTGDPESETLKCIAVGCSPCPVEFVDWEENGTIAWEEGWAFTHRQPFWSSVDSWEKLEKDAMGRACELVGSGHLRCDDCEWAKEAIGCQAMARLEILKRAKKLAGIEEEARNGNC